MIFERLIRIIDVLVWIYNYESEEETDFGIQVMFSLFVIVIMHLISNYLFTQKKKAQNDG